MKDNIVGAGLREARENKGLSVSEVSEKLIKQGFKASTKTIYSWECGNSQPTPDVFLFLCELYNVADILNTFGYRKLDEATELNTDEYPIIAKYRRLNDSGKEYIDSQLDYAFSQEKYRLGLTVAASPEEQSEVSAEEETVDIFYAAYGGDSGKVTIPKSQFDEAMKELEKYDYRTDK